MWVTKEREGGMEGGTRDRDRERIPTWASSLSSGCEAMKLEARVGSQQPGGLCVLAFPPAPRSPSTDRLAAPSAKQHWPPGTNSDRSHLYHLSLKTLCHWFSTSVSLS